MRCVACNAILPPALIYRTLLVPHPTLEGKTTTLRVEEDCCNKCANKSKPNFNQEDTEDLSELGIILPEVLNYDY